MGTEVFDNYKCEGQLSFTDLDNEARMKYIETQLCVYDARDKLNIDDYLDYLFKLQSLVIEEKNKSILEKSKLLEEKKDMK